MGWVVQYHIKMCEMNIKKRERKKENSLTKNLYGEKEDKKGQKIKKNEKTLVMKHILLLKKKCFFFGGGGGITER